MDSTIFKLPFSPTLPSTGPSFSFQLSKYQLQFTNLDTLHFYFQINSSLPNAKSESIIQIIHNFVFTHCRIITCLPLAERNRIVASLNEFGLDASVDDGGDGAVFAGSRDLEVIPDSVGASKRIGVNLIICLEVADTFQDYLQRIGKMSMAAGWTNIVVTVASGDDIAAFKRTVSSVPICIHPLPNDPAVWRDMKKLRAFADQQTQQMLCREERKVSTSAVAKPRHSSYKLSTSNRYETKLSSVDFVSATAEKSLVI